MKIEEKLEILMNFANLDGTEWGEMLQSLHSLYLYRSVISDELIAAMEAEIEANYAWAINNLEIITETEMVPHTTRRLEEIQ